ncbi:DUF7521 family protein [Halopelagius longus]|uniref:YapH protein n=1 Tax=Halopelagius longus TaxID=1236180 RepID=A0A1H1FIL9_9EURY|nr:hypothetical protein [Halopelagius longus]RDI70086.1 hypothetical protein DWB78_15775 [Halopelagius longus]SDR00737.1 hypothetical protein SAMN05216278_3231 [Halopelagius longus]
MTTDPPLALAVVVAKTVTLVLGGLVTFVTWKAFRRTGRRALKALFVGFAIVTLGSMTAGVVDQLLAFDPDYALLVESVLTAVGFSVIAASLYVE